MSQAHYFNQNLEPKRFEVLAENKDDAGKVESVDIGTLSTVDGKTVKTVVVAKAPVHSAPRIGHVVLISSEQEKAEDKAEDKAEKAADKQAADDKAAAEKLAHSKHTGKNK